MLLKVMLQDSVGTGLTALYQLYSSILKVPIVYHSADFWQMIGVLLISAPNHPLCEETIAELVGVRPDLVKMWVADLGSVLYWDEVASGGICVQHLSISSVTTVRVSTESTLEMQTQNWVSLASRRCLKSSVSISASSKIRGSLMRMWKISHHVSKRTFLMPCSIVLCIGQIMFVICLTMAISMCGKS